MATKNTHITHLEEAYISLHKKLASVEKICNVSKNEAEDLIQEGYLKLAGKSLETENEAKGKLWTTIRNLSIDRFRRNQKIISMPSEDELDKSYIDYHNLDYDIIKRQIHKILSPLQNRIMSMLINDNMDYPEIAAKLGMNEGTIRTNVSRARKILKEKLVL